MFTKCPEPNCGTIYRVTAHVLRTSMGMIRCQKCNTLFNALSYLEDFRPHGTVVPLSDHQLPFVQAHGDRAVIDSRMLDSLTRIRPAEAAEAVDAAQFAAEEPARQRRPDEDALRALEAEAMNAPPPTPDQRQAPAQPSLAQRLAAFVPRPDDLHYALRNLLRNGRRTAMALMAIGFGVVAVLIAGGFIEWSKWFLRETTIRAHLGHIQIVKQGYFESGEAAPFDYLLPERLDVVEAVEADPEVVAVAPRVSFSGLIGFGDVSVSFLGEGVDPAREAEVSRELNIVAGEGMSADAPEGIIVGKGLADALMVEPGQQVVLLANTESGGLGVVEARVRGVFQTASKAYDDAALRVPIDMAREMTRMEGTHRYVVLLNDTAQTDRVLARLEQRFAEQRDLEFVPWMELADFYKKSAALFAAQANSVWAVIALIIVVSISNTLVMNVVERTGEIGTLMALGLRGRRIQTLFVNEGLVLGLLGGAFGALAGWSLGALISAVGIPLPPAPGMDFPVTGEIMITWKLALGGLLLGLLSTVLASVYPARKASRLVIVDALRHGR